MHDVLYWIAEGKSINEIAKIIHFSPKAICYNLKLSIYYEDYLVDQNGKTIRNLKNIKDLNISWHIIHLNELPEAAKLRIANHYWELDTIEGKKTDQHVLMAWLLIMDLKMLTFIALIK